MNHTSRAQDSPYKYSTNNSNHVEDYAKEIFHFRSVLNRIIPHGTSRDQDGDITNCIKRSVFHIIKKLPILTPIYFEFLSLPLSLFPSLSVSGKGL
jgi:hypothetical protein